MASDRSFTASSALEYTKQEYWDRRFEKEETYDWLFTFEQIEALLSELISDKSARILVIGCGTSTLSCDMYKRGWRNITSTDFSEVVIKKMRERTKELAGLEWVQMDMCDLQFPDSTFDYCIDKAALDAVTADVGDVWNPHSDVILTCHRICCEIQRVLRPGGTLVMFSFHQPHFRLKFLRGEHCPPGEHDAPRYSWQVSHRRVEGRSLLDYFCYVAVR